MAGFVTVKLLKRFKKPSKNPLVQHKRQLFVQVLTSMRASGQPGDPDNVLDYVMGLLFTLSLMWYNPPRSINSDHNV